MLVGVALSAVAFGGVALANGGTKGDVAPSGAETITAQAPGARVAVYIEGGVAAGSFTVARQLGVVSVTNPSVGIFCIKPVSSVSTAKIVPTVSTEYENTEGWD